MNAIYEEEQIIMAETPMLQGGIYPPLPTFFDQQHELGLVSLRRHIQRLAAAGVAWYVVMGSNSEAVYLAREARWKVTEAGRGTSGDRTTILARSSDQ